LDPRTPPHARGRDSAAAEWTQPEPEPEPQPEPEPGTGAQWQPGPGAYRLLFKAGDAPSPRRWGGGRGVDAVRGRSPAGSIPSRGEGSGHPPSGKMVVGWVRGGGCSARVVTRSLGGAVAAGGGGGRCGGAGSGRATPG